MSLDGKIWRDKLYLLLAGAGLAALAWLWEFEPVLPDLAGDLAAAAGLRPPERPLALLWQWLAVPLCRHLGLVRAQTVLHVAGHVSFGLAAVLSARLFLALLPAGFCRGWHLASWWRVLVRFVVLAGVVLFCCSDPVWNAFRTFSPRALQILLALVAAGAFLFHLRTWRRAPLFAAFALLGLLGADTPVGFALLAVAVFLLWFRRLFASSGILEFPPESPFAGALVAWRLTLAWAAGFAAGLALEAAAFARLGALEAFGLSWDEYALELPFVYIRALLAACSPAGFAAIVLLAVLPAVLAFHLMRRVADAEKHLVYVYGASVAVLGLVAFSQLAPVPSFWFWRWGDGLVPDSLAQASALFLCALAVVWSLAAFFMELFLRNFRRIETLRFPDAAEEEGVAELAGPLRLQRVFRTAFLAAAGLLVFGWTLPARRQGTARAMLGLVGEVVRETARECRDVRWLFTDGGLDAQVELAAAAEGRSLYALSMMSGATDARQRFLRTRGVETEEDRLLFASGAADALRVWSRAHPEKAGDYAIQIGFELWRRDVQTPPECSGLVARPAGLSADEAARGAATARDLARRLLDLYRTGNPDRITDAAIRDAFVYAQWRLAVLARHRANAADARGAKELALEDTALADALDEKNGALGRIRSTMAWASRKRLERMTPFEGLRLGLSRADFALARGFAQQILAASPDHPEANFAVGMDYFLQKQYARAESYLSRCLVRRPHDPAVLNNLAQCRLRQGDFEGALPYARRALDVLPDSPEIKQTLARIEKELQSGQDRAPGPGRP